MPATTVPLPVAATRRLSGWLSPLGLSAAALDDTLGWLNPMWRVHQLQARVIARQSETPSACTLVLQVGAAFPRLTPGQFVVIGVTIDGVRHRRAYSPRTVKGRDDQIAITVQRQPGGKVSSFLRDELNIGTLVDIDAPAGDFVLPTPLPKKLLLIAGGSGITPCMSMLQHLHATAPDTMVSLLYFARSTVDRIFAQELLGLSRTWRQMHYVPVDSIVHTPGQTEQTLTAAASRELSSVLLDAACSDWRQLPTYCCGPAPLMAAAKSLWQEQASPASLHLEAFTAPQANGDPDARHQVALARPHGQSDVSFVAAGNLSLLVAGEEAGHQIKHGCRQGICHECTCRLKQGSVRDLISGERIDGEGQPIRLCVTSAMSDVELESMT